MTDTLPPPERMGLDAIRQAIEERDAMESQYHDLSEHMVYKGNSVSWWHSKATAYRDAIDKVWDELRAAGIVADGTKTCADGVRELAAARDAAVAAERELWAPLHSAVDDLMAFMGYHGSANARGDHAQAVMDALHALDAAMAGARVGTILPT